MRGVRGVELVGGKGRRGRKRQNFKEADGCVCVVLCCCV